MKKTIFLETIFLKVFVIRRMILSVLTFFAQEIHVPLCESRIEVKTSQMVSKD